jgi:hypothetical protein
MRRKHPFLLLELLIAMGLLSLCIVPLARMPMSALNSEIKTYQRLQLYRINDVVFADVKAALYANEIPWEQLDVLRKDKSLILTKKIPIKLKGIGVRQLECACYAWSSASKKGKNQEECRLVNIEVRFTTPSQRRFFLFNNRFRDVLSFHHKVFITQQLKKDVPELSLAPS